MDTEELRRRSIVATLLRCQGQHARPVGLSRSAEQIAVQGGYLRFNEWPMGHYQVTLKGAGLIAEYGD